MPAAISEEHNTEKALSEDNAYQTSKGSGTCKKAFLKDLTGWTVHVEEGNSSDTFVPGNLAF